MKKLQITLSLILVLITISACSNSSQPADQMIANQLSLTSKTMKLSSSAFQHNEQIPSKYTCDGEDISPPLTIEGVPEEAKSLVLIVDDPDAPVGDWVHWTIWNIPPQTSQIGENSVPQGIQGMTDSGQPGYGGPCPPNGTHRYFFKLYALDSDLDLPVSTKKAELEKAIESHVIDSTHLMGLYQRQ